MLLAAAGLLGAALAVRPATGPSAPDPPAEEGPTPPESRWMAAAGVAIAAVGAAALLLSQAGSPVIAVDALTTHLPEVARWIQTGSLWDLVQYAPELSNATYPQNGTLVQLAGVLPWRSTYAARYVDVPFFVVMALGVFMTARELRAPATTAALAAAAMTTLAAVSEPALEQAQVDPPMLAWFAVGAGFLVRAARNGRPFELALAGCALGLAFGAKWYAVAYVPVLVAVWLVARRGRAARWRELALLAGTIAAFGGFWLVRNWVLTGNPVHPARSRSWASRSSTPRGTAARALRAHRVGLPPRRGRLAGLVRAGVQERTSGSPGPVLLGLGAVAAAVVARTKDAAGAAVLAAALAMGALYTVLPDTAFGPDRQPFLVGANARYLVPALMAGAVLAAWLAGTSKSRAPRGRGPAAGAIVEGVGRSYGAAACVSAAAAVVVLATAAALVRWSPRAAAAAGCSRWSSAARCFRIAPDGYGSRDATAAWVHDHVPRGRPRGRGEVLLAGRAVARAPVLRASPAQPRRVPGHVRRRHAPAVATARRLPAPDPRPALRRGHHRQRRAAQPGGDEPELTWARALGYRVMARSAHLVVLARPLEGAHPDDE